MQLTELAAEPGSNQQVSYLVGQDDGQLSIAAFSPAAAQQYKVQWWEEFHTIATLPDTIVDYAEDVLEEFDENYTDAQLQFIVRTIAQDVQKKQVVQPDNILIDSGGANYVDEAFYTNADGNSLRQMLKASQSFVSNLTK